jgi:hypothetical protein
MAWFAFRNWLPLLCHDVFNVAAFEPALFRPNGQPITLQPEAATREVVCFDRDGDCARQFGKATEFSRCASHGR